MWLLPGKTRRRTPTWPLAAGTAIYVQVDSANANTAYGAVLENHEILGESYNNIRQTTIDVASGDVGTATRLPGEGDAILPGDLPPRQPKHVP